MLTSISLLKQIVQLYEQGHIKPIHPITQFESSKIEDAMRFMQKGSHIGKIVVTMPESPETLPTKSEKPIFELHENASYLLVGGLGGLGQAIAVWMAEAGVKEGKILAYGSVGRFQISGIAQNLAGPPKVGAFIRAVP